MMDAVCSEIYIYVHIYRIARKKSKPPSLIIIKSYWLLFVPKSMSCKPKPRNALKFWSENTGWPRGHHRALSKCCCISRKSVFQHLHSAFVEQQGRNTRLVLWRWKSRPAQVFQIKVPISSSTKMHGANTGVGSNTFCGSGVVFRTANRTTSQVKTVAWSASRTHHQLKRWTVKSVWVAAKKIQITFMQTNSVIICTGTNFNIKKTVQLSPQLEVVEKWISQVASNYSDKHSNVDKWFTIVVQWAPARGSSGGQWTIQITKIAGKHCATMK